MAALTVPELPELPENGSATIPELPAPPIGAGRNGKRERKAEGPDLFGFEGVEPRRLDRKQAAALVEVLKALRMPPALAWVDWMNSGAVRIDGRFVWFGRPGRSDVLMQLKDSRLLGCAVKVPIGRLRTEQAVFLDLVCAADGMALEACDLRNVLRELDRARRVQ
jgi:hypothetical protein